MSGTPTASELTAAVARFGPFFALETHPRGMGPDEVWQPLSVPLLAARVAAVGDRLAMAGGLPPGAVEPRVAASVTHLGLAARILSPALAVAVLYGRVLAPRLTDLRWQQVIGAPVPLSLPDDVVLDTPVGVGADELSRRLLDGPLRELAALMGEFSLSRHILWGNTASAVNGAATMIAASRPDLAQRTRALTARLFDQPPLLGAGATRDGVFRRRSCCLIYRAAPGGRGPVCGDCVLAR
ncbi:(2Fe-2S)-binding protein [Streptomyces sp. NPDC090306]|uniref:(2Fe-2S)-binding protein n=1 Tax=Streptomyces sp. NPDC090306 TaxID=3365961 RepID=UPI00382DD032